MARRSARIRKQQVSGPNLSHLVSYNVDSSVEQFPFMDLPREIRDMIYEACLAFDGAIFVRDQRTEETHGTPFYPRQRQDFDRRMSSIEASTTAPERNLFYVSKQVYEEALPIFYSNNTFELTSLTEMEKFIHHMGLKNRPYLRSVMVYYEAENFEYQRPLSLFARCVGLRDLTLVLCDECMEYTETGSCRTDSSALKELPAFNTLLRMRGLDNVRLVPSWAAGRWALLNISFEKLPAMEAAVQVMKQPRPLPQP